MINKSPKLIWGLLSIVIYIIMVGALVVYFNTRNEKKIVHYVKKDEKRIQVALKMPNKQKSVKTISQRKLKNEKKFKHKKNIKVKENQKKVIREKVVKKIVKKKDENRTKPTYKKASDLFSKVKTTEKEFDIKITDKPLKTVPKKNIIKITEKKLTASERNNHTLKIQKKSDSGVENIYFAKVQNMLEDWPAQSDFAGEKAIVILYIKPSGKFEFKVKTGSNIEAFNTGLIGFLEQLQIIGFGKHNVDRTYEFEAEFIAKE